MTIGAAIAFFVLALAALISAIVVVTHKNPVVSAVSLAFHLVAIAGLYFLMNAEFLALLQVIVYAGAILVLILFVLMLLNLFDGLRRLARRIVWLNPLLRFDGFEPKAAGIRALLPHVDAFVPAHNLNSLRDLAQALAGAQTDKRGRHRHGQHRGINR